MLVLFDVDEVDSRYVVPNLHSARGSGAGPDPRQITPYAVPCGSLCLRMPV